MCSVYELNIEDIDTFVEQRLLTLLNSGQLLSLSPESVALLFSDKRLSYVPVDLKIKFITQWIHHRNTTRMDQVIKLTSLIDLPRMTIEQGQFANQKAQCLVTYSGKAVNSKLLAYCFNTKQWFNLRLPSAFKISAFLSVDGCQLFSYNDEHKSVYVQDLEQKKSTVIKVKYDDPSLKVILSKLIVKNGTMYLIQTEIKSSVNRTSSVLMGKITHNIDAIQLTPVLFFKGELLGWSVNSSDMVAILFVVEHFKVKFNIYDTTSFMLYDVTHLIEAGPFYLDVFGTERGFEVIDSNNINVIMYQKDASVDVPFAMYVEGAVNFRYAFINKTCLRYSYIDKKLEETDLSSFLEHYVASTDWRTIELPEGLPFDLTSFQNLALMSLPMATLRCHFKCPHCQLLDEDEAVGCHLQGQSLDLQQCLDSCTDSDTDDDPIPIFIK